MSMCVLSLVRKGWTKLQRNEAMIAVRGHLFFNDVFYQKEEFASLVLDQIQQGKSVPEVLPRFLSQTIGEFSVAIEKSGSVFLVGDTIRSYELLYRIEEKCVRVFDDVTAVDLTRSSLDRKGIQDYISCGRVAGADTLYADVKSVQAGEIVAIENGVAKRIRYYRYRLTGTGNVGTAFDTQADRLFVEMTNRLLLSTKGKRLVIPLSGGYDSRLLVNYLFKAGVRNVLCYSYGRKDVNEALISRQVASALGYAWHFVEYTESAYGRHLLEGAALNYVRMARNGGNSPHMQEFMALKSLIEQGILIPNEDVIVPGFSFDMPAGSQVRKGLTARNIVSEVAGHEMYNWPKYGGYDSAVESVRKMLADCPDMDPDSFWEYVTWQERCPKWICNSVRAYEYFGFEWRMPLWERPVVSLWCSLPQKFRFNRVYFKEWFARFCVPELRQIESTAKSRPLSRFQKFKNDFYRKIPYALKWRIDQSWLGERLHARHGVGMLGARDFTNYDLRKWHEVLHAVDPGSAQRLVPQNFQNPMAWVNIFALNDLLVTGEFKGVLENRPNRVCLRY